MRGSGSSLREGGSTVADPRPIITTTFQKVRYNRTNDSERITFQMNWFMLLFVSLKLIALIVFKCLDVIETIFFHLKCVACGERGTPRVWFPTYVYNDQKSIICTNKININYNAKLDLMPQHLVRSKTKLYFDNF